MTTPILRGEDLERLMADVEQDGCWYWNGERDDDYRMRFQYKGVWYSPRDILCQNMYGITGLTPCKCVGCINPGHVKNQPRKPRSNLMGYQVLDILASKKSVQDLAETYGVSMGTIYDILNGKTWKHIPRKRKSKMKKRKSKPVARKPVARKPVARKPVARKPVRLIKTTYGGVKYDGSTGKYVASYNGLRVGEFTSFDEAISIRKAHIQGVT